MKNLKIKQITFDAGKELFFFINKNSPIIEEEGFKAGKRVEIEFTNHKLAGEVALVNDDIVHTDEIGLCARAFKLFGVSNGSSIKIKNIPTLTSFNAVKAKMFGHPIGKIEMFNIIKDIVSGYYTTSHIAAFCGVCEGGNMNYDEITYLTEAMVETGNRIKWNYDIVVDKHCIGGVPGNRTTNIAIPIVAAFGLHIPKTSSRAITSPSGTADTMEVFCNVDISLERMKEIVDKCYGCLVWGGSVNLSPSDDLIIETKKILDIDSEGQMVASILSKKIAAGSTHILIVVPVGPTAKVRKEEDFIRLKDTFESIGKNLGVTVKVAREDGLQPIGNGVGPALEAIDILKVLKNDSDAPLDLKEISIELAGEVLEFSPKVKKGEGAKLAREILESGQAYKKFEEIMKAQGDVRQIPVAKITHDILATKDGKVTEINNRFISRICRIAGAPASKVAGIFLYKHLGNSVKKGEKLFTIHSDSKGELDEVLEFIKDKEIFVTK